MTKSDEKHWHGDQLTLDYKTGTAARDINISLLLEDFMMF